MVVLVPTLEGERRRVCSRCSLIGIESPVSARSSFYARRGGSFEARCKTCSSGQSYAAAVEVKRRDPEAFAARAREYQRRYRDGNRSRKRERDRLYRERHREDARIDHLLRAERQGRPLPSLDAVTASGKQCGHWGGKWPAAPFVAWLRDLIREFGGVQNTIVRLGVSEKRFREYLHLTDTVAESVVDRCCSRDGRWMAWEIFERYSTTREDATAVIDRVVCRHCGSRNCDEPAILGGRFCAAHAERLARIRLDLDADAALMTRNGGAQRKDSKQRRSPVPCCGSPYCWNPRETGHQFCASCEEAGMDDEGE